MPSLSLLYLIEIMPENINKAHSLKLFINHLNIFRDEVMACGDNSNDAEMLEWAGTGVAVANRRVAQAPGILYMQRGTFLGGGSHRKFCMI